MRKLSWLVIAGVAGLLLGTTNPASARYLNAVHSVVSCDELDVSAVYLSPGIPRAEYQLPGRSPSPNRVPVDDEFWGSGKGGRQSFDPAPPETGDRFSHVWSKVTWLLSRIALFAD
jgi:hypothetical protein